MAVQPPALMTLFFILLLALQSKLDVTSKKKKVRNVLLKDK